MATKRVFKTTKEFFYNKEGFVIKEIETVEEYEVEMEEVVDGNKVANAIKEEISKSKWVKTTGVPNQSHPFYLGSDGGGMTVTNNGDVKITGKLSKETVKDIAEDVKEILSQESRKSNLTNDKAF